MRAAQWRRRAGLSGDDAPDVSFLTPRQAKGLEFESVILVEPAEMLDGITGSRDLYIGATRTTGYLDVVYSRACPVWDLTVESVVTPTAMVVPGGVARHVAGGPTRSTTEASLQVAAADREPEPVPVSTRDALLDYLEVVLAQASDSERQVFVAEVARRLHVSLPRDGHQGLFGRRRQRRNDT